MIIGLLMLGFIGDSAFVLTIYEYLSTTTGVLLDFSSLKSILSSIYNYNTGTVYSIISSLTGTGTGRFLMVGVLRFAWIWTIGEL